MWPCRCVAGWWGSGSGRRCTHRWWTGPGGPWRRSASCGTWRRWTRSLPRYWPEIASKKTRMSHVRVSNPGPRARGCELKSCVPVQLETWHHLWLLPAAGTSRTTDDLNRKQLSMQRFRGSCAGGNVTNASPTCSFSMARIILRASSQSDLRPVMAITSLCESSAGRSICDRARLFTFKQFRFGCDARDPESDVWHGVPAKSVLRNMRVCWSGSSALDKQQRDEAKITQHKSVTQTGTFSFNPAARTPNAQTSGRQDLNKSEMRMVLLRKNNRKKKLKQRRHPSRRRRHPSRRYFGPASSPECWFVRESCGCWRRLCRSRSCGIAWRSARRSCSSSRPAATDQPGWCERWAPGKYKTQMSLAIRPMVLNLSSTTPSSSRCSLF